jgi:iron complex outermembrane receptor protein
MASPIALVRRSFKAFAIAALAAAVPVRADVQVATSRLGELSLEQLGEVLVWTVSRHEERLDAAAAAVYVVTGEDIRRSGATTLPEALRLVPMLDIARADANQYAISARGFNNVLANKMLVLLDGRAVYSPLFSGVFWEAQDVLLEDVDRIEVVTGPSTALWGTNAVNGMINVITRSAALTSGTVLQAHAGDREHGGSVRQGWKLGEQAHARLYAKTYDRGATSRANGVTVNDQADGRQVGFRADWSAARDQFTLQGDAYRGTIDQPVMWREFSGANLLARWERQLDGSRWTVQGYLERTERDHPGSFAETLDTADIVAQVALEPRAGHRVLLGAGYRQSRDDAEPSATLAFIPGERRLRWSRLFAQDQVALGPRLNLTASLSLEDNPYTGAEPLPSLRLAWQPVDGALLWASAARAVRAPSRTDREFFQPARPPFVLAGGPNFESEVSHVLELGWRAQTGRTWSYAVTAFRHEHRRLRSLARRAAGLQFENDIEGHTDGLETWTRWRVGPSWRIDAGAVFLHQALAVRTGGTDLGGLPVLGNDPRRWASVRSALDLSATLTCDVSVRYVGARPLPAVPAYTAVDARLAWNAAPGLDLALRNLADPRHPEWGTVTNRVELQRAVSLQVRWKL